MVRQRVVVYVTRGPEILVFDHRDIDAGTQVPAGGVDEGETLEEAARREVREETGLELTEQPVLLGYLDHIDGLGQRARSAFLRVAAPDVDADRWEHRVTGDGTDRDQVFVCRFERDPALIPEQIWPQPVRGT